MRYAGLKASYTQMGRFSLTETQSRFPLDNPVKTLMIERIAAAIPMTLLSIRNQLIAHFSRSEALTTDAMAAIEVPKEHESIRDPLIKATLEAMADDGIIYPVEIEENVKIWMLLAPLGQAGQDIHVSLPVAAAIANTLNGYAEANGLQIEAADALNLEEAHIVGLIDVIGELLSVIAIQREGDGKGADKGGKS